MSFALELLIELNKIWGCLYERGVDWIHSCLNCCIAISYLFYIEQLHIIYIILMTPKLLSIVNLANGKTIYPHPVLIRRGSGWMNGRFVEWCSASVPWTECYFVINGPDLFHRQTNKQAPKEPSTEHPVPVLRIRIEIWSVNDGLPN